MKQFFAKWKEEHPTSDSIPTVMRFLARRGSDAEAGDVRSMAGSFANGRRCAPPPDRVEGGGVDETTFAARPGVPVSPIYEGDISLPR